MDKKRIAGEKAAEFVEDGMIVGLGTGSTAYWAVRRIGERVRDGLRVQGVPTSERTRELALELGIPVVSLDDFPQLDLTIDGADEIDDNFHLIKGGGGALFREKVVALASRRLVIVADDGKWVGKLGAFRLPVEVVPFGWRRTVRAVEATGCRAELRIEGTNPYETDNGNWILDCDFGTIADPAGLHHSLKRITGVVETGLFVGMADTVVLGTEAGVRILSRPTPITDAESC
ncbi:ribose-5-phosphate isomerase RpiA [Cohnella pontilimi]|uniref:Ribose-5-phosphate isomerase A n=1 Tax=Cohnella pontilimi TaxID=2564100 RepID=A0A4U0FHG8_9BACL|nr:ribose-5-phosphate isomerase RpiA [Cohnella pontilimi]TJY42872.1 ribose-5-phosphate isomerase RpiA [Cohnella pontilimi]